MNNILIGANSRAAIADVDLNTTGLTAADIEVIYEVEGHYRSWKPGRDVNAFHNIETGKGYIVISLKNLDLTALFGLNEFLILDQPQDNYLKSWTLAQSFAVNTVVRDQATEAILTANVVWPDGSTGVFTTDSQSTDFPGAVDSFHVTYIPETGDHKRISQPAVTRDVAGAVTTQPQLVITVI